MDQKQEVTRMTPGLAAKNRRLTIILGLVALGFYVGFVLMQMK